MTVITDPAIEKYCARHSTQDDDLLTRLADETERDFEWARMMVGNLEGAFLSFMAKSVSAKRMVEIGTFTGSSAIWLARALPPDGHLFCLDHDPVATAVAARYLAEAGLAQRVQIMNGDALELLDQVEGPLDLVFLDADKERYVEYLDAVLDKLAPGGVVLADNVLWSGRVLDPETASDRGLLRFAERVASDPALEHVMVPLRDGVSLVRKSS